MRTKLFIILVCGGLLCAILGGYSQTLYVNNVYIAGATGTNTPAPPVSGECTNVAYQTVQNTGLVPGNDAAHAYLGGKFAAPETMTLCKVSAYIGKIGTPTGNVKLSVWSRNTGTDFPDTKLAETANVAVSTITADTYYEFPDLDTEVSLTVGTYYYIILYRDTIDGSNVIAFGMDQNLNTGNPNGTVYSADASTWLNYGGAESYGPSIKLWE